VFNVSAAEIVLLIGLVAAVVLGVRGLIRRAVRSELDRREQSSHAS